MTEFLPYMAIVLAVLNTAYIAGAIVQRISHLEKRMDVKEGKDETRDKTLNEIQVTLARIDGRLAAISSARGKAFGLPF